MKLRKIMLLLPLFAIGLCFVDFERNGPFIRIKFESGIGLWWNMRSPSGEQTGFCITKEQKTLISLEEWNKGLFINFNYYYYGFDPDHCDSGYWIVNPPESKPKQLYFPSIELLPMPIPVLSADEAPPIPDVP